MPFATPYSYAAKNPVVLVDVDEFASEGGGCGSVFSKDSPNAGHDPHELKGDVIASKKDFF